MDITYSNGYIHVGGKPGLGVDVGEDAAAKYKYDPKFLPTLRDKEGAVHDC